MKQEDFENLQPGDVVRNKHNKGNAYIIHANYGGRVTAVRVADMTNPTEWELVEKCTHKHVDDV